jgi:hypothetical protein
MVVVVLVPLGSRRRTGSVYAGAPLSTGVALLVARQTALFSQPDQGRWLTGTPFLQCSDIVALNALGR